MGGGGGEGGPSLFCDDDIIGVRKQLFVSVVSVEMGVVH